MTPILKSKAFWTAIFDLVVSLILLLVGLKYPAQLELVKSIIVMIQPVILMLIAAFTVDDTVKVWATTRQQELVLREYELEQKQ